MTVRKIADINSLKIEWQGTTEYIPFNFVDLESNVGEVRTFELWGKGKTSNWVEYVALISMSEENNCLVFSLSYEKEQQIDKQVIGKSFWGTTTITYEKYSKTWAATWTDNIESKRDGNAPISLSNMPDVFEDVDLQPPVNKGQRNEESVTKFLASLGCKLRIGYYWSAKSEDDKRVIFTIWDDQLKGDRYVLLPKDNPPWASLPGAYEIRRHIPVAMKVGSEVFGMRCRAKDPLADTRSREYYNELDLLVLRVTIENGETIATVVGEVSVESVKNGTASRSIKNTVDALYDLNETQDGVEVPLKVTKLTSGFLRDRMIRDFVIRRANGKCEYCGTEGFEMSNGKRYIEAHHVIALSNNGADTIGNVIGLCANHHREAHYGAKVETLNAEMSETLKWINLQNR